MFTTKCIQNCIEGGLAWPGDHVHALFIYELDYYVNLWNIVWSEDACGPREMKPDSNMRLNTQCSPSLVSFSYIYDRQTDKIKDNSSGLALPVWFMASDSVSHCPCTDNSVVIMIKCICRLSVCRAFESIPLDWIPLCARFDGLRGVTHTYCNSTSI